MVFSKNGSLLVGKKNSVLQAVWSPHLCMVTKRQNLFSALYTMKTMHERAVTFEGSPFFSEEVYVAPHIHWQVQSICNDIVTNIQSNHRIALHRMVLYFKMDRNSKLWLLWASSIRVQNRTPINFNISFCAGELSINDDNRRRMFGNNIKKKKRRRRSSQSQWIPPV